MTATPPLTEPEARGLLARVVGEVRDAPAPVVPILEAGRSAHRRRRRLQAALAVAVVVAAGLGGLAASRLGGEERPRGPEPASAPGMRLVGMDDVVVEVPDSWVTNEPSCGYPDSPYVYFEPVPTLGCTPQPPGPFQQSVGFAHAGDPGVGGEGAGCGVDASGTGVCRRYVPVAGSDVVLVLEYDHGDATQRALSDQVAASVHRLSDGWTTVPFLDQYAGGGNVRDATDVVTAAGLTVGGPPAHGRVRDTDPSAGAVVRAGSAVRLVSETAPQDPVTIPTTVESGTTPDGRSYGGAVPASPGPVTGPAKPDLLATSIDGNGDGVRDDGIGYTDQRDLADGSHSRSFAQSLRWSRNVLGSLIPVYGTDGTTILATLETGDVTAAPVSGHAPPEAQPLEAVGQFYRSARNTCLYFSTSSTWSRWAIVPWGWHLASDGITVDDADGRVVVRLGDRVTVEGSVLPGQRAGVGCATGTPPLYVTAVR